MFVSRPVFRFQEIYRTFGVCTMSWDWVVVPNGKGTSYVIETWEIKMSFGVYNGRRRLTRHGRYVPWPAFRSKSYGISIMLRHLPDQSMRHGIFWQHAPATAHRAFMVRGVANLHVPVVGGGPAFSEASRRGTYAARFLVTYSSFRYGAGSAAHGINMRATQIWAPATPCHPYTTRIVPYCDRWTLTVLAGRGGSSMVPTSFKIPACLKRRIQKTRPCQKSCLRRSWPPASSPP